MSETEICVKLLTHHQMEKLVLLLDQSRAHNYGYWLGHFKVTISASVLYQKYCITSFTVDYSFHVKSETKVSKVKHDI